MWAWFQCRTSPKDICDVTIWPIHRVLLFIELCGANRPCIWPTSVLQKWACPMTKQFPVCWTSLARSDPSSLRVINIFGQNSPYFDNYMQEGKYGPGKYDFSYLPVFYFQTYSGDGCRHRFLNIATVLLPASSFIT
jgi:hypothetical protein